MCLGDAAVPLLVLYAGSTCTSELGNMPENVPSYTVGQNKNFRNSPDAHQQENE